MSSTVHIPFEDAGPAVKDVMMLEPRSVGPDTPIAQIRETFDSPSVKLMLVTDGERFLGTVTRDDLPADDDGPIGPHVRADTPSLKPDDPVDKALELFNEREMSRIPVVTDGDRLEGLVCLNKSHEAFCIYPR
ncbi:CBS domain-containing protein [Solirubrobacter sp. CPCC 204708]|uniref:CBS domain-containing protein n=1 Tax=Solirubrobacter deserti TaxID=2282478 RepID=A0ABT4RES0_9ACTN|nr:CBS domain-containing protein [Solirubrobacter deserti]MBE2318576.1 CBS domain-containing protein [Solirubrobacter deserti]MDA0137034.1 CBS domain-containing protein [Solirubrobacter deserti]